MRHPVAKTILLSSSATILLWLGPTASAAEEVFTDAQWTQTSAAAPRAQPSGEIVGKSLLSIGMSLAVVIALALVLGWLVKRLGVKRLVLAKGRHLEVVDSVALGFKRQASLLRIGDQVILVGVGEHEVTHLATLPASVLEERGAGSEETAPAPAPAVAAPPDPAFSRLLGKVLKG